MSSLGNLFGGGKKADTSAIDAQVALLQKQQADAKAQSDALASEASLKADAMRQRRMGINSLINTSPLGVQTTLG